jgi:hypothetical protein
MTAGLLLDDHGEVRATVERDPQVGELIAALLGRAPDCAAVGCGVCWFEYRICDGFQRHVPAPRRPGAHLLSGNATGQPAANLGPDPSFQGPGGAAR